MNKLNQNKIRGNDNFYFYLLGHWAFLQTNIGSKSSKFTGNSLHALFAGDYAVIDFVHSFNYIGHWVGILSGIPLFSTVKIGIGGDR